MGSLERPVWAALLVQALAGASFEVPSQEPSVLLAADESERPRLKGQGSWVPQSVQGCSEAESEERLVPEPVSRLLTAEVLAVPKLAPRKACS